MSDKVAHFRAAQRVAEHPLAAVELDVPSDIRAAVDHISQMQSWHGVAGRSQKLSVRAITTNKLEKSSL